MAEQLTEKEFLKRVKHLFKIAQIYYPGCQNDRILEESFRLKNITYSDNLSEYKDLPKEFMVKRRYVIGNYVDGVRDDGKHPLFRDGVFDALFYKDNHASLDDTVKMLATVRQGGVIIYCDINCDENIGLRRFEEIPCLRRMELPFSNRTYTVFQKT